MNLKSAHTTSSGLAYSEVGFLHICLIIFRETAVNLTQQCANINWNTNKASENRHFKPISWWPLQTASKYSTGSFAVSELPISNKNCLLFLFNLCMGMSLIHGNWNCLYYPKLNSYKLGKFQNYSEFQHFSSEDRPPMLTLLRATKHL